DIIARCNTCRCCFCFVTAHSAAFPASPSIYIGTYKVPRTIDEPMNDISWTSIKLLFCTLLHFYKCLLLNSVIMIFASPPNTVR
ncbi:hypothetical protein PAXRUDRAFT_764469, partial [Paxillus rubicundulus Ve08.2h10]